tara:strand:- start:4441 stop:4560 length:120 start_codon:yes stop_codon:yes gene_type:complete
MDKKMKNQKTMGKKSTLTAKQKTLPPELQKKILASKKGE